MLGINPVLFDQLAESPALLARQPCCLRDIATRLPHDDQRTVALEGSQRLGLGMLRIWRKGCGSEACLSTTLRPIDSKAIKSVVTAG